MVKEVELPQIGRVVLTKRRASKHIRLRIDHDGVPKASLPYWVTYGHAIDFVASKTDWIVKQQANRQTTHFRDGQRIGKAHVLRFQASNSSKTYSRIKGNEITIFFAPGNDHETITKRAIVRVLKAESESLLLQRLQVLAKQYGFTYSEGKIGSMRSRWGSCNTHKLIMLSCYLVQLPWELIDYVILHELVHTEIMAHNDAFWDRVEQLVPDAKARRKALKRYHPQVLTTI
jgi:predicted metal-dependent hydrolase